MLLDGLGVQEFGSPDLFVSSQAAELLRSIEDEDGCAKVWRNGAEVIVLLLMVDKLGLDVIIKVPPLLVTDAVVVELT